MSRSIEPPPPPPLPEYSFRDSKRSVYSGSSSHRFMDPDVIEVPPPPIHSPSNLMKQKGAILHDVIDIDNDNGSADLIVIGEKANKIDKGKTIEAIHGGYGDHQVMELFDFCLTATEKSGAGSGGLESSNGWQNLEVSHNLTNVDGHVSDQSYDDDDDDYADLFADDLMDVDEDDPYALQLQAHFDNEDIPPGVEAPVPCLAEYGLGSKKTEISSLHPWFHTQSESDAKHSHMTNSSQPFGLSLQSTNPGTHEPPAGISNFQIKLEPICHPSGLSLSSHLFPQTSPSKKKLDAKQRRRRKLLLSLGAASSKPQWCPGPLESQKEPNVSGASTTHTSATHGFINTSDTMQLPEGSLPSSWPLFGGAKAVAGSGSSYHTNFTGSEDGSSLYHHHAGTELPNPLWWKGSSHFNTFTDFTASSDFVYPVDSFHAPSPQVFASTWVNNSVGDGNNGTAADSTVVTITDETRDEILKKFQSFKQFDTVEDTSDHHFVKYKSMMKLHSKNLAKRIQEEWKILEKDLPDSILVRVYESRIDLLRAVIIGAEGTPYHDGLFFFDVFFPSTYPNTPPLVHYHAGGLRLNPNLYNCGKVCLSLLNTWSGDKDEKWIPGVSTILQVLVSIQGLILNTKPYFNEPGYARTSGTPSGEMKSLQYNEDTFILSLRTMVYMMRRPPKNFEDFVIGHFCGRAQDILVACKAYMDGAQVGCLVKGGVQDVDQGDKSCSKQFQNSLPAYVDMLARGLAKVGAKDCEKFFLTPPPPTTTSGNNKPLVKFAHVASTTFS